MFERRRRLDGDKSATSEENLNLTKYSEKYILPTDGGAVGTQGVSDFYTTMPQDSSSASPVSVAPAPTYEKAQEDIGERPLVFAVKNHRNMYVYEYSDRLEYYLRTQNGMFLYNKEFKKK